MATKRIPMKTFLFPLCVFFLFFPGLRATAQTTYAPPVVSNVVSSQRAGTKLVDIYYNLTPRPAP